MNENDFPALYRSSDRASAAYQASYLRLIAIEYALLLLAAVLSLNWYVHTLVYVAVAIILTASAGVLLYRSLAKPEQDWYRARALAESVKTLSWRYAMAAHPFHEMQEGRAQLEFRENLERVFRSNSQISGKVSEDWSGDQITPEMDRLRTLSVPEKRQFYETNRIRNQQTWYTSKARKNRLAAKSWVAASLISYGVAIGLSLLRIAYQEWQYWPTEPLIVVATSILGWLQIKKYNELAAAYSVTAQEIGMINITLSQSEDVTSFSDFVIEAETAFSREHTLWIARQAN